MRDAIAGLCPSRHLFINADAAVKKVKRLREQEG